MSESHVPEGWAPKPVSELADTFAGGTPNRMRQNLFGGEIPWVKSTEVNLRRIDNTDENKPLTDRGLSSSAAKWVRSAKTPLVPHFMVQRPVWLVGLEFPRQPTKLFSL